MTKRSGVLARVTGIAAAVAVVASACGGTSTIVSPASDTSAMPTTTLVSFYEQRVDRDPNDFFSHNNLATLYLQRAREAGDVSDFTRAATALDRSLTVLPRNNYTATAQLATVYNARHQFDEGVRQAEQAIAADPRGAIAYGALGDADLALGRYGEAEQAYLTMATIDPGLPSLSRLARLRELQGQRPLALQLWSKAIVAATGRFPENTAWANAELGNLYFNEGKVEQAQGQYELALSIFPGYVYGLAGLGKAYAAQGQWDKAIGFYRQAIDKIPLPEYVIALGDVYAARGNVDDAKRQYALMRAIDKLYQANGINTDLQMALFAADHGSPADALAKAKAARAARPDMFAADALAWALYQSGDYAAAMPLAQEALSLGSKDALLHFHAGMIAYRLGDSALARQYLEDTYRTNPNFSVQYQAQGRQVLGELSRDATPAVGR
ncbi:MAG: tetratricopeptide repeat protein [Chloroflexi bacterium]|nr:tetratricopeptide repeat protein [Chloroflexota bacterium]